MAVPNAPLPLFQQLAPGTSVVITMTLQGLSSGPSGFTQGGTTFNSGNPTATFTGVVPGNTASSLQSGTGGGGQAAITNSGMLELLNLLDLLWREGDFTVA
jgi:hypothetical protein